MKKSVLTSSLSVLIIVLLVASAVFRNQWIVIGALAAWTLFLVFNVLHGNRRRIARWVKRLTQQSRPAEQKAEPQSKMIDIPDVSDPPALVALRHLNCRITDKLKSAYPDVTWNWEVEQPDWLASKGGTGRIKLHQAGEFTHAEVTVDQLARIDFKMMKLVDINSLISGVKPAAGESAVEPVTTDAAAWFDLVGREQLTAIVTELNTRNHRKLSIAENGDVYVVEDDASVKQSTLENLPGKNYWNELSTLIADIGIKAQVTGDQLRLAW